MRPIKNILLIVSICLPLLTSYSQNNRINHNGQDLFLSGMNLAWINFASDLISFNPTEFTRALDEISNGGGNTMRWWLHTNGVGSPLFAGDTVQSPKPNELANLQRGLDSAKVRGIGLVLCLWSFDMLKSNLTPTVKDRNKLLLNDTTYTRKYIKYDLIPMLDAVADHPAIICWEVFNEPEGMWNNSFTNWSDVDDVPEKSVQQFINKVAGAIHRHTPTALVSNGAWGFRSATDVDGNFNYYTDARLIDAGGDPLGTLDFYMIHYYEWAGTNGPFDHPASHWGLDKPLVIGEFSAKGPKTGVDPNSAYNYLYNNGYAGALSWTWTGHDGNGNVYDASEGMLDLYYKYPGDIVITYPSVDVNYIPTIVDNIDDVAFPKGAATLDNFLDAKDYFFDAEDGTALTYTLEENTNTSLVTASLTANGILDLALTDNEGLSKLTIHATDKGGRNGSLSFYVVAYDTAPDNKAVNRHVYASSSFRPTYPAAYAVDSNIATYWNSKSNHAEWIAVQFEKPYTIEGIKLNWGSIYPREYEMQVSDNGTDWTTVYSQINGKLGMHVFDIEPTTTSYLKFNGLKRNTSSGGYILKEFEAYEYGFVSGISSFSYDDNTIAIYPVPAIDELTIQTSTDVQVRAIKILNEAGQFIDSGTIKTTGGKNTLDISGLSPGAYFLFIYTNEKVVLKKFIKQ